MKRILILALVLVLATPVFAGSTLLGPLSAVAASSAVQISPNVQTCRVKVWCPSACTLTCDIQGSEGNTDGWISLTNGTTIVNPTAAGTAYTGPNPGKIRINVSSRSSGSVYALVTELK